MQPTLTIPTQPINGLTQPTNEPMQIDNNPPAQLPNDSSNRNKVLGKRKDSDKDNDDKETKRQKKI